MLKTLEINDIKQTAGIVWGLAEKYNEDCLNLFMACDKNILRYYEKIKSMPYRNDPSGEEFFTRPAFLLAADWEGPLDCDDKALLMLCYGFLTGSPDSMRLVISGEFERPGHIYTEIKLSAGWIPADATYPERVSFGQKLHNPEGFRKIFPYK